ncbi:uncharacterized protein BCR38DRAFT_500861 [Pseudomassariella vexata]|uniref:Uncharacterized protein n=1 Tax=Pseudomassariella vexata TaxID=1141098 RepID=A0A1Y2DFP4_9PEZI|nr:uncharacterized protein BCR38DRAFT_500861 [Pseudomassariella vexata]ORY58113.1 hypothetical protein BCR38DRAFT_500861 [Pseudomassariella vexata]
MVNPITHLGDPRACLDNTAYDPWPTWHFLDSDPHELIKFRHKYGSLRLACDACLVFNTVCSFMPVQRPDFDSLEVMQGSNSDTHFLSYKCWQCRIQPETCGCTIAGILYSERDRERKEIYRRLSLYLPDEGKGQRDKALDWLMAIDDSFEQWRCKTGLHKKGEQARPSDGEELELGLIKRPRDWRSALFLEAMKNIDEEMAIRPPKKQKLQSNVGMKRLLEAGALSVRPNVAVTRPIDIIGSQTSSPLQIGQLKDQQMQSPVEAIRPVDIVGSKVQPDRETTRPVEVHHLQTSTPAISPPNNPQLQLHAGTPQTIEVVRSHASLRPGVGSLNNQPAQVTSAKFQPTKGVESWTSPLFGTGPRQNQSVQPTPEAFRQIKSVVSRTSPLLHEVNFHGNYGQTEYTSGTGQQRQPNAGASRPVQAPELRTSSHPAGWSFSGQMNYTTGKIQHILPNTSAPRPLQITRPQGAPPAQQGQGLRPSTQGKVNGQVNMGAGIITPRHPSLVDPAPFGPTTPDDTMIDPALLDPALLDPAILDDTMIDPELLDPALLDPAILDDTMIDPELLDPALLDPAILDDTMIDPALLDPALLDPATLGSRPSGHTNPNQPQDLTLTSQEDTRPESSNLLQRQNIICSTVQTQLDRYQRELITVQGNNSGNGSHSSTQPASHTSSSTTANAPAASQAALYKGPLTNAPPGARPPLNPSRTGSAKICCETCKRLLTKQRTICNYTDQHGCSKCAELGLVCVVDGWALPPHPLRLNPGATAGGKSWTCCSQCEHTYDCERSVPCDTCIRKGKAEKCTRISRGGFRRYAPGQDLFGYYLHLGYGPNGIGDRNEKPDARLGDNYHLLYAKEVMELKGLPWYGPQDYPFAGVSVRPVWVGDDPRNDPAAQHNVNTVANQPLRRAVLNISTVQVTLDTARAIRLMSQPPLKPISVGLPSQGLLCNAANIINPHNQFLSPVTAQPIMRPPSPGPPYPLFADPTRSAIPADHPNAKAVPALSTIPLKQLWTNGLALNIPAPCQTFRIHEEDGVTRKCNRLTKGACENVDNHPIRAPDYALCDECAEEGRQALMQVFSQNEAANKLRLLACQGCTEKLIESPEMLNGKGYRVFLQESGGKGKKVIDPRCTTSRHIATAAVAITAMTATTTSQQQQRQRYEQQEDGVEVKAAAQQGSAQSETPTETESETVVHGLLTTPQPITGCSCATKLFNRRICRPHLLSAWEELIKKANEIDEFATKHYGQSKCFVCWSRAPVDPQTYKGPMVWACAACQGIVIGVQELEMHIDAESE